MVEFQLVTREWDPRVGLRDCFFGMNVSASNVSDFGIAFILCKMVGSGVVGSEGPRVRVKSY